jgi:MoaA/NifB/PqqE/SkfB family radical SAM enzyme
MWMTTEDVNSLSTAEKVDIIGQFAKLNEHGEVVLTGGETMRKLDEFFALIGECRRVGLRCSCNTNASYINRETVHRLITEGPDYLVISLDSHRPELHDFVRGVPGAFSHAVNAIRELVADKAIVPGSATSVFTNTVLFEENIYEIMEFVRFAEDLKLDGIIFQLLSDTFWNRGPKDLFFENHFFKNKPLAKGALAEVARSLPFHPVIRTTRNDFRWMQEYIDAPNGIKDEVCGSHEKNVIIDSSGNTKLCFNMARVFHQGTVGNVRQHKLRSLWYSDTSMLARRAMDGCRLACGMLNCHRKEV